MANRAVLLAVAMCAAVAASDVLAAADVVQVRLLPGYPPVDHSAESIELRIERVAPGIAGGTEPIDGFFQAVATALRDNNVSDDWAFTLPDAPFIEITIHMGGRRQTVSSKHMLIEKNPRLVATERGVEAPAGRERREVVSHQSERFRQHRIAFERIINLIGEHLRARLP